MEWSTSILDARLDVNKARELVDGYAPSTSPYRDLGEPSWFATDHERRSYWGEDSAAIVEWARDHGLPSPRAAMRYGLPSAGAAALWSRGS